MRFLTDQDVYQLTIEFLIKEHHDVIPVKQLGLERAPDILLLRKAKEMDRIFVTRDKDFGTLVFFEEEASGGVILCGESQNRLNRFTVNWPWFWRIIQKSK